MEKEKQNKKKKFKIFTSLHIAILALVVYGLLYFVFDDNGYSPTKKLEKDRDRLMFQADSLRTQIKNDSLTIVKIGSDDLFLERYARENYYMKADNEDIFIAQ